MRIEIAYIWQLLALMLGSFSLGAGARSGEMWFLAFGAGIIALTIATAAKRGA